MATEVKDVEADALYRLAMRKLTQANELVREATEMMESLYQPEKRKRSAMDENGEPTWAYLVKVHVPEMQLTKKLLAYGEKYGFNAESMHTLMHGKGTYEGFLGHYRRTKTKWQDWSLVFMKWVRTEHERKQKAQQQGGSRSTRFDQQRTRG